jgi:hypothetical protein
MAVERSIVSTRVLKMMTEEGTAGERETRKMRLSILCGF